MEFSKNGKILLAVGFFIILSLAAYLTYIFVNKDYSRVFADQSTEQLAKIVDSLEQAGIAFEYPKNGSGILIEDSSLSKARVQLSKDAVFSSDIVGFEFFSESQHAMSDFYQKVNYQRALQGELERSLILIEGISGARVHLAIPKEKSFSTNKPDVKAAVTIELTSTGRANESEIINAAVRLVASSVPDLKEDKVSILDSQGRAYSTPEEGSMVAGIPRLKNSAEKEIEEKIKRLMAPFYAADDVGVSAWVEVNNNKVSEKAEGMDTSKEPAILKRVTETTQASKSKPKSTVLNEEFSYQTLTRQVEYERGYISRMTVSVLLPKTDHFTDPELIELIKTAVGIDETRGDKISVLQFLPEKINKIPVPLITMAGSQEFDSNIKVDTESVSLPVESGSAFIYWLTENAIYVGSALLMILVIAFGIFFINRERMIKQESMQIAKDIQSWIKERKVEQNLKL